MSFFLSVSHLDFEYESAAAPLFTDLSFQLPAGWTGLVGSNGAGKSTLLRLLTGKLKPDNGHVGNPGLAVLCGQEVFSPPENLQDFFTSDESYARRLRGNLRLDAGMAERWSALSMGERKKIQIACALFSSADILCLDEPTNHLDSAGRELLAAELRSFRGIGILVSHDRGLLDALCERCLFLESGRAVMRPGNLSSGVAVAKTEQAARLAEQLNLQKELKRRKQELQRRREKEQQARNRDNKRKLDRNDHDGKGRIDAARVTGRDRRQGDLAGKQAREVERAAAGLAELGKIRVRQYGLKIPYGRYSRRDILWHTAPEDVPLGGGLTLRLPELRIASRDRVAIAGANGTGKTTLLNRIVRELKLSGDEYLYMPQELDDKLTAEIHQTLKRLPRGDFGKVMNVAASLGSEPEKILDARNCSPGEWRKLFFGLGVLRPISLIALDEPTNHLDLPSIECLEAALAECEAALLLISHDRIFLDNLCSVHWRIEQLDAHRNILIK